MTQLQRIRFIPPAPSDIDSGETLVAVYSFSLTSKDSVADEFEEMDMMLGLKPYYISPSNIPEISKETAKSSCKYGDF